MAIFHLSQQIIGRSQCKSAVAAAAYRSCTKLVELVKNSVTGLVSRVTHDYSKKQGLYYREIIAPNNVNSDSWVFNRESLWNKVHESERYKNGQYAREFNIALPIELSNEENRDLIKSFVTEQIVLHGMIADIAMHIDNKNNPHAHVMMTMRNLGIDDNGNVEFKLKNTSWNERQFLLNLRSKWSDYVNSQLKMLGFDSRITEKSFKELGLEINPTMHEGRGRHIKDSDRTRLNNEIIAENAKAIVENPEMIIDLIKKKSFSKVDIEKKVVETLRLSTDGDTEMMASKMLYCIEKVMSSERLIGIESLNNKNGIEQVFISKNVLEKEKDFVDTIASLNSKNDHVVLYDSMDESALKISAEQMAAINGVCFGQNISIIEGLPGAGKTTVVKEIACAYKKNGYEVYGASISSIATRNLALVADIECYTIAKWCYGDIVFDPKTVFIIDEMSMLDFDDASVLLKSLNEQGCKVVLIGDTNQFGALFNKGAASKALDVCGSLRLNEVRRHNEELHRKATRYLSQYKVSEALDIYNNTDSLKIFESNAMDHLIMDYVNDYVSDMNKSHKIIAYTNNVVSLLNEGVRGRLKELGFLKDGIVFDIKKDVVDDDHSNVRSMEIAIGDRIIFNKNNHKINVLNGEEGTVININKNGDIVVRIDDEIKRSINFNVKEHRDFKHSYAITCYKSQGATYDNVRVYYEDIMNYESFNVMMTRHRENVKLYVDKHDLLNDKRAYIKDNNKLEDVDLVKKVLEFKFTKKSSNLLSMDLLNDKSQIIKEYIETKNLVRILSKRNSKYGSFDSNKDRAINFKDLLNKRTDIAIQINGNIGQYKEYLAYAHIPISEVRKHAEVTFDNKLQTKFMKDIKEQIKAIESEIIIKIDQHDKVLSLYKEVDVVEKMYWKSFDLAFKCFKDPVVAESRFRGSYFFLNKRKDLTELESNPEILGKLKGIQVFGIKLLNRKESESEFLKHVKVFKAKDRMDETMNKLHQNKETPKHLRDQIEVLEQKVQELSKQKDISAEEREETKNFKRNFVRFNDIKLTSQDHEDLFREYIHCMNHVDKVEKFGKEIKSGSITMNLDTGLWIRFSSEDRGNIYHFISKALNCSIRDALLVVANKGKYHIEGNNVWKQEEEIYNASNKVNNRTGSTWQKVENVPEEVVMKAEDISWIKQEIKEIYEYRNIDNKLLGYTVRCEKEGEKNILPMVLCSNGVRTQWMSRGFGNHLYREEQLNPIVANSYKDVLIVEGEKTAEAAAVLFPELTVIGIQGVNRIEGIDFSILQGRSVTIMTDHDDAGRLCREKIADKLKSNDIEYRVIDLDQHFSGMFADKWDLADELPNGICTEDIRSIVVRNNKEHQRIDQQKDKGIYNIAKNIYNLNEVDSDFISKIATKEKSQNKDITNHDLYVKSLEIFNSIDNRVKDFKDKHSVYLKELSKYSEVAVDSFVEQYVRYEACNNIKTRDVIICREVAILEHFNNENIIGVANNISNKHKLDNIKRKELVRIIRIKYRKELCNDDLLRKGQSKYLGMSNISSNDHNHNQNNNQHSSINQSHANEVILKLAHNAIHEINQHNAMMQRQMQASLDKTL